MYHIECDSNVGILKLAFSKHVDLEELRRCRIELETSLQKLRPGFRLLTDLSGLEEMDFACASVIRDLMVQFRSRGVSRVVRVIPDRRKDIGFSTMSYFHYGPEVSVQTVESLAEGLKAIAP